MSAALEMRQALCSRSDGSDHVAGLVAATGIFSRSGCAGVGDRERLRIHGAGCGPLPALTPGGSSPALLLLDVFKAKTLAVKASKPCSFSNVAFFAGGGGDAFGAGGKRSAISRGPLWLPLLFPFRPPLPGPSCRNLQDSTAQRPSRKNLHGVCAVSLRSADPTTLIWDCTSSS